MACLPNDNRAFPFDQQAMLESGHGHASYRTSLIRRYIDTKANRLPLGLYLTDRVTARAHIPSPAPPTNLGRTYTPACAACRGNRGAHPYKHGTRTSDCRTNPPGLHNLERWHEPCL
ncbi:hypothetical protein RhiJN_11743 [Ceratobasidium sp. AG-Ba]|nr:hypothetical protein RhiJN_07386 [Ceratobasidium sp. AG-Ba]QRV83727.1 hypothetical protein RhiJN_11743 [Ceratobasidium sp. AG-Ba]QRW08238.1 hypothetical protein RhiLY_07237 [Ceratobasidium sp. AG-Ba]